MNSDTNAEGVKQLLRYLIPADQFYTWEDRFRS